MRARPEAAVHLHRTVHFIKSLGAKAGVALNPATPVGALEELAGDYHRFYDSCRVLPQGDEEPTNLHAARLALCQATRQVIANGLGILGVTAPERM